MRSSRTPDSAPSPQGEVLGAERAPVQEVLGAGRLPKTGNEAEKPAALWLLLLSIIALIGAGIVTLKRRAGTTE